MLKKACLFCKVVGAFAIIGALNWGLVGLFDFNAVEYVFGPASVVTRTLYSIIGLSGVALLVSYFMICPSCRKSG